MSEPEHAAADDQRLYEELEGVILGGQRTLTRGEVAERAGVPLERAIQLWRSLGFTAVDDDETFFTEADVEALRSVDWLVEQGFVQEADELTLVRSMGRTYARLTEWEVGEMAAAALAAGPGRQKELEELVVGLIPVVEDVQNYVWRRHLASAAGRLLLRPQGEEGRQTVVGFADIVNFTRRSRSMDAEELGALIESFESSSASIVAEHGGQVIKTIGDEVMFTVDDPVEAARVGLALVAAEDDTFPELRVGLAHGTVLSKLGDVFGPVVNIAARLTKLAKPGRILVDRELSAHLREHAEDQFRLRRARTASVRGYKRLETWSLTPPRESS
ncbi:adenylate/guanylate cyclase domain-containing protein [Nocardioides sp. HDW12B]|uniref:adenylate/guanylate cyclase domain-containing protein n=1 Tax=Nocardioides sp. HDW12B TaxID=2714939 RepID=UPI001408BD23|nr:adenylate/guanylate cyclase domain-containing protein [Nocardioides sp. HDW12B]QIK67612.1 adenylate/guanylate cyclase domain-containing protein [Nocardioides sp. HDW12B]